MGPSVPGGPYGLFHRQLGFSYLSLPTEADFVVHLSCGACRTLDPRGTNSPGLGPQASLTTWQVD